MVMLQKKTKSRKLCITLIVRNALCTYESPYGFALERHTRQFSISFLSILYEQSASVFKSCLYRQHFLFYFTFLSFFLHSNVAELCSTVIVVFSSILRLCNDFLWAREQISPESVGLSTTIDVGFCK